MQLYEIVVDTTPCTTVVRNGLIVDAYLGMFILSTMLMPQASFLGNSSAKMHVNVLAERKYTYTYTYKCLRSEQCAALQVGIKNHNFVFE